MEGSTQLETSSNDSSDNNKEDVLLASLAVGVLHHRIAKRRRALLEELEEFELMSKLKAGPSRSPSIFRERWNDEYLIDLAIRENSFIAEYRMDPRSFDLLAQMLDPALSVDRRMVDLAMSKTKSRPISTASRIGAALIMLGGGRSVEAMRTHGLAKTTCHENFKSVVRAINSCPQLSIACDNRLEALKARAAAFQARSDHGLFKYCTGAIDGLSIAIRAPKKVDDQKRFFSGNKKKFCLNMQGVCDAQCRFLAVTCMHVGSTNDVVAFQFSSLKELSESQLFPFHWNGDAAYTNTMWLMAPYDDIHDDELRESLNFFHSQLRITIERAFGILIQRFGIFWSSLKYDLAFIPEIVHACCRLHNFCIDQNIPVLNDKYNPPEHARLNEKEVLNRSWKVDKDEIHNYWTNRLSHEDNAGSGNALREEILKEIEENNFIVKRSHH